MDVRGTTRDAVTTEMNELIDSPPLECAGAMRDSVREANVFLSAP